MSKSIYDEVLDILDNILDDSFSDPQDEYNDCYMLNFKQIIEIEKVIKEAQKQEKLLELYREYFKIKSLPTNEVDIITFDRLLEIKKQIEEIENEL